MWWGYGLEPALRRAPHRAVTRVVRRAEAAAMWLGCDLEPAQPRGPHRAAMLVVPRSMSPRWAEAVAMCRGCGLEPVLRRDPHRAVTLVVPLSNVLSGKYRGERGPLLLSAQPIRYWVRHGG